MTEWNCVYCGTKTKNGVCPNANCDSKKNVAAPAWIHHIIVTDLLPSFESYCRDLGIRPREAVWLNSARSAEGQRLGDLPITWVSPLPRDYMDILNTLLRRAASEGRDPNTLGLAGRSDL